MNIYVYSDESGEFDKTHNSVYVYGGLIFLDKSERDNCGRKYIHIEKCIRETGKYVDNAELKASSISNKHKHKLYNSLKGYFKFGGIIKQELVLDEIFKSKKDKQRYLDYVYKLSLKNAFKGLVESGNIQPENVEYIYIFADEHTTATNGLYDLRESLEQEFKRGIYNYKWTVHFPPIFENVKHIDVKYVDSKTNTLIRASDIVANNIYYNTVSKKIINDSCLFLKYFPR